MKMHFTMIINGEDSVEKKFQDAIEKNPQLHMHLIQSFAHAVMMGLGLREEDNVNVCSFKVGKIPEVAEAQPTIEKKVDN